MTIVITIPHTTRDHWSGDEVDTTSTFHLSVYQAESLVSSINSQIPAERERNERARKDEIARLESRLHALKGQS